MFFPLSKAPPTPKSWWIDHACCVGVSRRNLDEASYYPNRHHKILSRHSPFQQTIVCHLRNNCSEMPTVAISYWTVDVGEGKNASASDDNLSRTSAAIGLRPTSGCSGEFDGGRARRVPGLARIITWGKLRSSDRF